MSGYQLAYKLRSHLLSFVRRVPLLAVAEKLVLGNTELARAAGFVGCLTKPIVLPELSSMLRRLHD